MPREEGEGEDEEEDEEETGASNASMLVDFTEVMKMGVFVQARSSFHTAVSPLALLPSVSLCFVHAFLVPSSKCTRFAHPGIYALSKNNPSFMRARYD